MDKRKEAKRKFQSGNFFIAVYPDGVRKVMKSGE